MILLALVLLLSRAGLPQEHAIYKSVDRGVSWTKTGAILAGNPRINSLGETADRIFAGTDAGIYSSGDGGKAWQTTSVTARTISFATSGKTIYAGTQSAGLYPPKTRGSLGLR